MLMFNTDQHCLTLSCGIIDKGCGGLVDKCKCISVRGEQLVCSIISCHEHENKCTLLLILLITVLYDLGFSAVMWISQLVFVKFWRTKYYHKWFNKDYMMKALVLDTGQKLWLIQDKAQLWPLHHLPSLYSTSRCSCLTSGIVFSNASYMIILKKLNSGKKCVVNMFIMS